MPPRLGPGRARVCLVITQAMRDLKSAILWSGELGWRRAVDLRPRLIRSWLGEP